VLVGSCVIISLELFYSGLAIANGRGFYAWRVVEVKRQRVASRFRLFAASGSA